MLPGLRPWAEILGHDLCDAALAAYTAVLYYLNQVQVLGSGTEGTIVIPV